MRIQAQLFAILRERAGRGLVEAELAEGATVADALEALAVAHPALGEAFRAMPVVMAVNQEYAARDQVLREGDELALVPPVSGGTDAGSKHGPGSLGEGLAEAGPIQVEVTGEPLSLQAAVEFVTVAAAGAIVTFQGVTRRVQRLEYEAYVPMAERRIRQICEESLGAHAIERVAAAHRVGAVELGQASVVVAVSAAHRPAAFEAGREVIDRIKAEAPIWKREVEGTVMTWVEGSPPPLDSSQSR